MSTAKSPGRKPPWLKVRLGGGPETGDLNRIISERGLHTVCEEALCPNRGECWGKGRATLMILGGVCSRNCAFCGVAGGRPVKCDPSEPARVAEAVKLMGLRDVVITSVTRDDLADGGAAVWAATIAAVRRAVPGISLEALIPDFDGSLAALDTVLDAIPEILAHNLETVARLYPLVRPRADCERSLNVLRHARERGLIVKSGIMVGLGETRDEVLALMRKAVETGCAIFTIGQYLQPTARHLAVENYLDPGEFESFREEGLNMGFKVVVAGPLVRSSYHSKAQDEYVKQVIAGSGLPSR